MALTAHFIDSQWKLHKRILNFCQVVSHKGDDLGKAVEKCLLDWGIDRVFTITVDNAYSNDGVVTYLRMKIRNWDGLLLDGEHLHVRCFAHILNLVVKDGMKELAKAITRIRDAVRYVKSSPARLDRFKQCVAYEKLESKGLVCLDVDTRWNSTYLMLESANKYRKAFERLAGEDDSGYKHELDKRHDGIPTLDDWANVNVFLKFLKVFYEITVTMSGSLYATSNKFFEQIYLIHGLIQKHKKSGDPLLSSMAFSMEAKFEKYWGNNERANHFLYVAVVLDPRYKLKPMAHCLDLMYGCEVGNVLTKKVETTLRRLYDEYKSNASLMVEDEVGQSSEQVADEPMEDVLPFGELTKHLYADDIGGNKTEVDHYLMEVCEKQGDNFDVLNWWKVNSSRYKILALIAKDILAIPVTTVASESAFSTGGRTLECYRSSLNPKTAEALICTQNWLQSEEILIELEDAIKCVTETEEGEDPQWEDEPMLFY